MIQTSDFTPRQTLQTLPVTRAGRTLLYCLLLAVLYGAIADQAYGQACPSDSLVGRYPLDDGIAVDASGNRNDGTVVGATSASDRFGNADGALRFDGDDYVTMGDVANLIPEGTIALYFKPEAGGRDQVLVTKGGTGTPGVDVAYTIYFRGDNRIRGEVGDGSPIGSREVTSSNPGLATLENWHHIVFRFDATSHALFHNGVRVSTGGHARSVPGAHPNPLFLGRWNRFDGSTHVLHDAIGVMDQVEIYDRALSDVEIEGLFAEAPVLRCSRFEPFHTDPISVTTVVPIRVRAELADCNGSPVTGSDISSPPVLQIAYDSQLETAIPVTAEPALLFPQGNQFVFRDGDWLARLRVHGLKAPGTYTVRLVSADSAEYLVEGCAGRLVVGP